MSERLSFHNIPIVIDNWQKDDTYDIYTVGSRVKDAYFSPKEPKEKCIKPDWRYLFKLSRSWCPWQFWGEIIAYRFGSVIGVKVPPAHIGLSKIYEENVDTYAALIEWFYDENKDTYITGEQIMVRLMKDFDTKKGRKHSFKRIRSFSKHINKEALNSWASILTFDTLIGNTDRHQENWGLVLKDAKLNPKGSSEVYLSPAFDNGTALCYEILEQHIDLYEEDKLERYLKGKKAMHHMKWSLDLIRQLNFYEFMKIFAVDFPQIEPIIAQHLSFSYQQVEEVLAPLVGAVSDPKYKLTRKRLDFVLKLIFARKRILEETLEL